MNIVMGFSVMLSIVAAIVAVSFAGALAAMLVVELANVLEDFFKR